MTRANPRNLPWFDAEYTDADTLSWEVRFTERLRRDSLDAGDFRIAGSTATVTGVTLDRDGTLAKVTAGGGNLADYNGTVTLELAPGQNIMDLAGTTLTDTSIRHAPRENSYEVQNYAPASNYLVSNISRHSHLTAGGFSDFDHAGIPHGRPHRRLHPEQRCDQDEYVLGEQVLGKNDGADGTGGKGQPRRNHGPHHAHGADPEKGQEEIPR